MRKLSARFQPLTPVEQRNIIDNVIPSRIALIEGLVTNRPTFGDLTAATIHARALAGFLGIRADQATLQVDDRYHDHGGGRSYEIKISDIKNGILFTQAELETLSSDEQDAIRVGFDTTNREFAHLTFWSDPVHQQPGGAPRDAYLSDLADRVSRFCDTIIRLLRQRTTAL